MKDKKIPLNQLMENAKNGIISREIYIEKTLKSIADATLYYFANRGFGQPDQCNTIKQIINRLNLPAQWIDTHTYKDLVLVVYQYYESGDQEKNNIALDVLLWLAKIAADNYYHRYY